MKYLATLSAVAILVTAGVVATSCGGGDGPYCGNGKIDPGEFCDDGNDDETDVCLNNCTIRGIPTLTVKWEFNKDAAEGFTGDSCTDLGVSRVMVELIGGAEPLSGEESCSFRQVVFQDIGPATYTVRLSPVDIDGNLVTAAPFEEEVEFTGGQVIHESIIGPENWPGSYTGTFFFRLSWAGMDCGTAVPPVTEHVLTLEQNGQPVSIDTTDGDPLDGSAPGTCRSLMEEFPQSALEVPFGPAVFTIVGRDSTGTAQFEGTFSTFVGAGVSNPELVFDVPSLAPDGGVPDAGGIDGSVADAGPPDA